MSSDASLPPLSLVPMGEAPGVQASDDGGAAFAPTNMMGLGGQTALAGLSAQTQLGNNLGAPVSARRPAGGTTASGRPSVMQLVFRERGALYAAYMPVLAFGGLFVPTTREYHLGDDIYLLLTLPDDPQRYPVAGKVAWITPGNVSGGRTQGVGVAFPSDEKSAVLRARIEEILGTHISSQKPTQTV